MELLSLIFSGVGAVGAIGAWIAAYHIYRLMLRETEKAALRQSLASQDLQRRAQAVGRVLRCTGDKAHWVNEDIQLASLRLAWMSQEKFIKHAGYVWEQEGSDKSHIIEVRTELHNYARTFCDQCQPQKLEKLELHTLPAAIIYRGVRALLVHSEPNAAPGIVEAAAKAEREYPKL